MIHRVPIDGAALRDWTAFHDIFASKLGFPSYYGRNLDAWHDCFYSLAEESTVLTIRPGDVIMLDVTGFEDLKSRNPEMAEFILEGSAFVNLILNEAKVEDEHAYGKLGAVAVSAWK